jgi:hypothetical protein
MHQRPLQTVEKALKTLSNTKLEQKLDKILTDTVEN